MIRDITPLLNFSLKYILLILHALSLCWFFYSLSILHILYIFHAIPLVFYIQSSALPYYTQYLNYPLYWIILSISILHILHALCPLPIFKLNVNIEHITYTTTRGCFWNSTRLQVLHALPPLLSVHSNQYYIYYMYYQVHFKIQKMPYYLPYLPYNALCSE